MKALTVHQMWAFAIALGYKPVENRTRGTSHRGELAIHAGLKVDRCPFPTRTPEGRAAARALDAMGGRCNLWEARYPRYPSQFAGPDPTVLALGAVIAVVNLTGVCDGGDTCQCGPWAAAGQKHWQLTDAQVLNRPVPARGYQGLWNLADETEADVRRHLKEENP